MLSSSDILGWRMDVQTTTSVRNSRTFKFASHIAPRDRGKWRINVESQIVGNYTVANSRPWRLQPLSPAFFIATELSF